MADIIKTPFAFIKEEQDILLEEVDVVFTEEDNLALTATPDLKEVKLILQKANYKGVLGMAGFNNYLYHKCF